MTTLVDTAPQVPARDDGFFLGGAIAMAFVIVAGFSFHLAAGRSTFTSPIPVHAHAIVFMGWVVLYLLQNIFVTTGRKALHRRLGWLATGWIVAMIVLGCIVTVAMVRSGRVPFFFQPLHFLIFDPMMVFAFAALTVAAIALRRRTDWHRRLHFCAMSMLVGPGLSRLLPSPLLMPWAWEVAMAASAVFPLVGAASDLRRNGTVHPAWTVGLVVMAGFVVLTEAISYSPVGAAFYRQVTVGSPGAALAPLSFGAPPSGLKITRQTAPN